MYVHNKQNFFVLMMNAMERSCVFNVFYITVHIHYTLWNVIIPYLSMVRILDEDCHHDEDCHVFLNLMLILTEIEYKLYIFKFIVEVTTDIMDC